MIPVSDSEKHLYLDITKLSGTQNIKIDKRRQILYLAPKFENSLPKLVFLVLDSISN